MSLSRYKVSSMEKYDKEISKLITSIILLQCRRTFRSIPIFLSWKGKLAASTKVKIIQTPLLHTFCSAPQKLRASYRLGAKLSSNLISLAGFHWKNREAYMLFNSSLVVFILVFNSRLSVAKFHTAIYS